MTPIQNLVKAAYKAGMPKEQLKNLVHGGYAPNKRALDFHAAARQVDHVEGQAIVGYAGPRGEAKTHAVIAQVVLDDCIRWPGIRCLYLRKIKASSKEQLGIIISKVSNKTPKNGVVTLANGSTITIGGFKDQSQLASLIGLEYPIIIIEDATTLDEDSIDKIRGACRSSQPGVKPRLYMPSNPGSIGHAWYKKLLYDPYKRKQQVDTRFIHAQRGDNRFIDKGYRSYLDGLRGLLRRIWRDGDMEVAAGQFFTAFDEDVHVIKREDVLLDVRQLYWIGMDYGRVHWNATYLACRMGEDTYIVDECAYRGLLPEENAYYIIEMLGRWRLKPQDLYAAVAGHDIWARRGTTETIQEQFSRAGLEFTQAKIDRINGAGRILQLLGNPNPSGDERYIAPRLFILDNCVNLIDTLPKMIHDEKRVEDVKKVDADPDTGAGGDDPYDAARYLLMEDIGGGVGVDKMKDYRG